MRAKRTAMLGEPSPSLRGQDGVRFAVVASLLVHAALIAWLAAGEQPARPPAPPPEEQLDPPSGPTDTLVEIVLLDEPTPVPAGAVPPVDAVPPVVRDSRHTVEVKPPVHDTGESRRASDAGDPGHAIGLVEASPATSEPRKHFAMRRVDLSPRQIADRVAAREAAPGELPLDGRGTTGRDSELRPAGRGTYTTDLGGSHWLNRSATAYVARDGTVKFENAPDFDIHFVGLGFVGKFNPDDWLARRKGIDPYASAKLAFLDRTRDERVRLAEVNRADDLARAQPALRRNLDAARAIADPAARKQALFELWDDVAETGDDALVRAGAGARAYLVGAIRAMRPAFTFTPEELARLNANRRSRAVFDPYE
jgi:hypothetical protein